MVAIYCNERSGRHSEPVSCECIVCMRACVSLAGTRGLSRAVGVAVRDRVCSTTPYSVCGEREYKLSLFFALSVCELCATRH